MDTKSRRAARERKRGVGRYIAQFLLAGIVALVGLTLASLVASRQAGTDEAIRDAQERTAVLARRVVQPRLTPALIAGGAQELAELDATVAELTASESFVHLRLWSTSGQVIYSDQPGLTGVRLGLGDHARLALETGEVVAEVSDLTDDENVLERDEGRLLEVYQPVTGSDGTPLLLETYFPFVSVTDSAQQIWWKFLPAILIPLILLELIQIPLAVRLARKVQHTQDEREELLEGIISAGESERKTIAHDLHDGAVQDLAGATYALSVATERAAGRGDQRSVKLLQGAQGDIRRSIQSLRSLFVEIYPPNLQRAGLQVALSDLLAALDGRGIESSLSYPDGLELPSEVNAIFYRVAQETTRNAVRHAAATRLSVGVETNGTSATLMVSDDGAGFDMDAANSASSGGHLGLRMMADLVADAGGILDIQSKPGEGTEIMVTIPQ